MSNHEPVAWIFLAFLALPVVFWFLFWLLGLIRRRLLGQRGEDAAGEGD